MDQMTDPSKAKVLSVSEFYDALAADYDAMTNFQKRFVQERPFFRLLVERYKIKTALDAGCGTGFHSLLLAQLGVRVTAVDISAQMLRQVDKHAKQLGVAVKTVQSSFEMLGESVNETFDAVFSLGNSFVHLLTDDDRLRVLRNFASLLKPSGPVNGAGILFLQNLNYERILAERQRIQSVKEVEGKTFVRFYDYRDDAITFNILTIEKLNGHAAHKLASVPLRPLLQRDLLRLLEETGFVEIHSFGGITMEEFNPTASKDLVVLARRAENK